MEDIPLYVGKRKNILVLSGGGIKGLATLGSLKCLMDNEIIVKPDIICATSIGSVIGLFLAIGYTPQDIYNLLYQIDFSQLLRPDFSAIFDDICFGLDSPDSLMYIVSTLLDKKKVNRKITFKELYDKFKIKLIITGTCLNDASIHYFSINNDPSMQILKAIRISTSIPLIFKPYKYKNKLWIDGGCIDNYPIALFKDKLSDVIGILLDEEYEDTHTDNFDTIGKYFNNILKCFGKCSYHNKYDLYQKNTIHIMCKPDNSSNWSIDNDYKDHLFNFAYDTTKKFLNL
jgi:NTE family protein